MQGWGAQSFNFKWALMRFLCHCASLILWPKDALFWVGQSKVPMFSGHGIIELWTLKTMMGSSAKRVVSLVTWFVDAD